MSNANRDENRITTITAVSNADGRTPLNALNSSVSSHALMMMDGTTGSVPDSTNAPHDENTIPTLLAASSSDGITPVTLALDSTIKALLIQST